MNLISNALNDKLFRHFAIVGAIYVPVSIVVAIITNSFLNIMLGWNVILAFIPIILAYLFQMKIKEENIDRLFERFYRVDKSRSKIVGGTGLGLAIAKHALINLNGSIEVESKEMIGTKFIVKIPI